MGDRKLTTKKAYIRFVPNLEGVPEHLSKVYIDNIEYDTDTHYKIICGHTDSSLRVRIELPDTITALLSD